MTLHHSNETILNPVGSNSRNTCACFGKWEKIGDLEADSILLSCLIEATKYLLINLNYKKKNIMQPIKRTQTNCKKVPEQGCK